jgi:hypothetical protein
MAIRAFTDNGRSLLARIRGLIDQGHIDTWSYDKDGDFTHTPPQFKNKAWLHPEVQNDRLRLRIIPPEGQPLTREVFAVYQGRFIEMLIAHVPDYFTQASAGANPVNDEPSLAD